MLNKSTKIILNYVIGLGLFAWLSYSIFRQVRHQENLQLSLYHLRAALQGSSVIVLAAVLLMMGMNWALEARKWQLLVEPLEKIPFRRAFSAVLSGVSLSVNTPNRVGEYGGRILYLHNDNKLTAITATMVGSFSQLLITILAGIGGFAWYIYNYDITAGSGYFAPGLLEKILLAILAIIAAGSLCFYFRLQLLVSIFKRIPVLRRLEKFVVIVNRFSARTLGRLLMLSLCRYLVFSAQYLILLQLFGVQIIWWQGFLLIFLIYLVMAIVPTIAIAELGIRGQIGLYFLGLQSMNKVGIIAATFGIWFINLIIPAIAGSVLILGIKVFSDK